VDGDIFLAGPLNLDAGEFTDLGPVNQHAVLRARAGLADALFEAGDGVIVSGS
jgi:hypothetical protein